MFEYDSLYFTEHNRTRVLEKLCMLGAEDWYIACTIGNTIILCRITTVVLDAPSEGQDDG